MKPKTRNSKPKWKALCIKVPQLYIETVSVILWELETIGIVTDSEGRASTQLIAYFNSSADLNALAKRFYTSAEAYSIPRRALSLEKAGIADEDWLARWRETYKPFPVGEKFLIGPTWEKADREKNRAIIRLDPGMAFGTGTHESTQLCLLAIERYYEPCRSFLDVGTGSGILAIAAAKLLARSRKTKGQEKTITAIDEDPQAVDVARKNALFNGVARWITLQAAPLANAVLQKYDFVTANLTAKDLKENADRLFDLLKPGGYLTLSGILRAQKREVLNRFKKLPLQVVEVKPLNEWVGIVLQQSSVACAPKGACN
jgi:ribosomal protein L11 methyltransferase